MKKILLLIGLALLVLPLALALTGTSQQQISGGETYYFYYADKNNVDDHHLFASQTFVMGSSEYVTGIYLKLKKVASIWNPCWYDDKFDVELRDKYDNTIASKNNLAICSLSLGFKWKEIKFDQPVPVESGEKYKIVVLYKGNALKESPNFAWGRSTFDVYASGSSTDGNFVESPKDFTFKIRGYKS